MTCPKCLLVVPDHPVSRAHHERICERVAEQRRAPRWRTAGHLAKDLTTRSTGGYSQ